MFNKLQLPTILLWGLLLNLFLLVPSPKFCIFFIESPYFEQSLAEAIGSLNARGSHVNLSDGEYIALGAQDKETIQDIMGESDNHPVCPGKEKTP